MKNVWHSSLKRVEIVYIVGRFNDTTYPALAVSNIYEARSTYVYKGAMKGTTHDKPHTLTLHTGGIVCLDAVRSSLDNISAHESLDTEE